MTSFAVHEDLLHAARRPPPDDARSRRGRSARASARRSRPSIGDGQRALVVQRTGWGKSLVYWIATRVRRDEGHGPTLIVSPLLALMRNQIAMAGRLGLRAATINSGNIGRVGRRRGGPRGRRDRRPADLARAPRQRAPSRTGSCPRSRDRSACSSSTRRTASATGATTSGPTTGGSGGSCAASRRRSRSWRRRRPPTTGSSPTSPSSSGRASGSSAGRWRAASLRLDAITLADQAERLAWLAEAHPEPARQRHRLLPDGRRHAAGRHLAALARHRRPCLQRGALDRGARGARGRADRRRDEGARRDGRARDGLRQAGPRLRRPLPAAGLADRLLPAGGPRRAGGRLGLRHPPRPAARTTRSPSTSSQTAFPPTVNMEGILDDARSRRSTRCRWSASSRRSTCRRAASSRRSSCSRSTARWRATAAATRGPPNRGRRTRRASSG